MFCKFIHDIRLNGKYNVKICDDKFVNHYKTTQTADISRGDAILSIKW